MLFIEKDFEIYKESKVKFQQWASQEFNNENLKSIYEINIGDQEVIFSEAKKLWMKVSIVNMDDKSVFHIL